MNRINITQIIKDTDKEILKGGGREEEIMKTLVFRLTMPGRNSWDGCWSGDDRLWAIVRTYKDATAEKILAQGSYYYSFGDGWAASVDVRPADASEVRRVQKKSAGFAGYDWMVDSIEKYGEILNSLQEAERRKAVTT